ncbi:hypothetical protein EV361DRAFT_145177 [Lentinula raphanica]|nr:hypothetical protein EV361DRAFT_145177 [Lentinula raphanica]
MAHRRRYSSMRLLLVLGPALFSIAVAAPLLPPAPVVTGPCQNGSGNTDLLPCSIDSHTNPEAGATTQDLSQTLPDGLPSSDDDDPGNVHRLSSRSSPHPPPLSPSPPVPAIARPVVLEEREDNPGPQLDHPPAAAGVARPSTPSPSDVQEIIWDLGHDMSKWTVNNVYRRLTKLKTWKPDMINADGDWNVFYETTSGKMYDALVTEIQMRTAFDHQELWVWVGSDLRRFKPDAIAERLWNSLVKEGNGFADLSSCRGDMKCFQETNLYHRYSEVMWHQPPKVAKALAEKLKFVLWYQAHQRE